MIRLTSKVFTDLAIWMIGLGLVMGFIFPFFVVMMGVPTEQALTLWFFVATMTAGFIVGGANIWLARKIVGSRLHILADHMKLVEINFREISRTGDTDKCTPEACFIPVDSADEIGESGKAFNYLIEALATSHRSDEAVRSFSAMLASQLDLEVLVNEALQQLLRHTEANAGAILIAAEGQMKIASSQGVRSPNAIVSSDYVRRALQTEKPLSVTLPEDVVVEGVLTDFRPREVLVRQE